MDDERQTPAAELSDNALRVLKARYLRRDMARHVVESPEEMFERVAKGVAEAEYLAGGPTGARDTAERFHRMLASLDFLPNSPTLMNAGTVLGQLSACFVLPVEDPIEDIFEAVKRMAIIQRSGGGTGFSFSELRPRGDVVGSTGGQSSGPVSFMKVFDCVTQQVQQGGKRRGANMGVLRCDHPDILEFIEAKREQDVLSNFNISIAATDAFMRAVRDGERYALIHPRTAREVDRLDAREVFEAATDAAWRTGDPGLIFWDAVQRGNPLPQQGPIEATNPCGEIPLYPYESCNLGSINLAHMVERDGGATRIDWNRLRRTASEGVRFLDDVIEINRYPVSDLERMAHANRKIGLGVMGFAELLIQLGVSYDSDEAERLGEEVMRVVDDEARRASEALARERGVFPNWRGSRHEAEGLRVRNATRTAIAPTGTISILAGTSASIEPLFALAYRRKAAIEEGTLYEVNPVFVEIVRHLGLDVDAWVAKVREHGRLGAIDDVSDDLKRRFTTALEVPPERHLRIQAAFQKHCDNSVSKTINLPQDASPEDVGRIYRHAWELGLKGVTIFRYGSKGTQVLELGTR